MVTRTLLCLICLASHAAAQSEEVYGPPAPSGDPVLFCAEPNWTWGRTVVSGEVVKHAFVLENRGAGVLEISGVRPGCGCQAVRYDRTIGAGASAEVVIEMRTDRYSSPTTKHATVLSNDPQTPRLRLSMGGVIRRLLKSVPANPCLEGLRGEEVTTTVTLKRQLPGNLKILSVTPSQRSGLQQELIETKPGDEYTLKLTLPPEEHAKQRSMRSETLSLAVMYQGREMTIPLRASVRIVETVTCSARYILFPPGEVKAFYEGQGRGPERSILLKGFRGREFAVTDVEVRTRQFSSVRRQPQDPPRLDVRFARGVRKSSHTVRVSLTGAPPADKRRIGYGEILIRTDDLLTPELSIPATVYYPAPRTVIGAPGPADRSASSGG